MSNKINNAFHELIKNVWKSFICYNQQGSKDAIYALRKIQNQLENLIHDLKKENK